MSKTTKYGRSHFVHELPDGGFVCWGWNFRPAKDPFKKALRSAPVSVYAYRQSPIADGSAKTYILPETKVAEARLVREAASVGRAALRERVLPVVRALAAGYNPLTKTDEA
jgi:hypothetical protein